MVFDQERFWRVLIVLAIVLAGFALGFALVQTRPVVVQGGFSQQVVTMVEYRVTDGSSRISYGGDSYTVTDGLVSLPYTATWAADMVAAGILERVGAPSANLYYGGNALRVATSGTLDIQSGAVLSINAPIRTDLAVSGTLNVVGAVTVTNDIVVTGMLTLEGLAFSGPVVFGNASGVVSGTTIAHGLGTTPTAAALAPSYLGAFTNTIYVLATDATSITVALGYSEGVTTTDVYWFAGK